MFKPSFKQTTSNTSFAFGTTGNVKTGTVICFNPVTGTDTINKNQMTTTINTRHECITCMEEYEDKSLEELRLEDYLANRKGQSITKTSELFNNNTLFGSKNTFNNVFGITGNAKTGTMIHFKPVTDTDTINKNEITTNINITYECITCMEEYEDKSLEELRLEYYLANRKRPQQAIAETFGQFNSNTLLGNQNFGTVTSSALPYGVTPFVFNTTSTVATFGTKPFGATTSIASNLFSTPATQSSGLGTSSDFGSFGVQNTSPTISFFKQQKPVGTDFNIPSTTGTGFRSLSQPSSLTNVFETPKPVIPIFSSSATGFGNSQSTDFSMLATFEQRTQNINNMFSSFNKPSTNKFEFSLTPMASNASTITTGLFRTLKPFSQPAQPTGFDQPNLNTSSSQSNKINESPQQQTDIHDRLINISTLFPKNPILERLTPEEDLQIKRFDQNLLDLVKTPTKVHNNSNLFNNSDTENRSPPDESFISTLKKTSSEKNIESENSSKIELQTLSSENLLNNVVDNQSLEHESTSTMELQLFRKLSIKNIPVEEQETQESKCTICIKTEPLPTKNELIKNAAPEATTDRTGYFPEECEKSNLNIDKVYCKMEDKLSKFFNILYEKMEQMHENIKDVKNEISSIKNIHIEIEEKCKSLENKVNNQHEEILYLKKEINKINNILGMN